MKLFAMCLVVCALAAACSDTPDSITADPVAAEPTAPDGPAQAEPTAEVQPTVVPQPTPTPFSATVAPTVVERRSFTLWFPKRGASSEEALAVFPYERNFSLLAEDAPEDEQIREVLDLWIAGPGSYGELGHPLFHFADAPGCVDRTDYERFDETIVVTLCGEPFLYDDRRETLAAMSLSETFASAGLPSVVLLPADRNRCIGSATEQDPLACLPTQARVPAAEGSLCPLSRRRATVTVSGVDEWVNSRFAPSTDAALIGQIDLATNVRVIPSTLTYDGATNWWVEVEDPVTGHCVWIAAEFLTDENGQAVGPPIPGVTFTLPSSGTWSYQRSREGTGSEGWLDEGFVTGVWVSVEEGSGIDDHIARVMAAYDRDGYTPPDEWFRDVPVAGADRAVEAVQFPSETGDTANRSVLIEVGGYTITAATQIYIEDLDVAPFEEMQFFLESIVVDPELFLAAAG